jgi:hypothetical protein
LLGAEFHAMPLRVARSVRVACDFEMQPILQNLCSMMAAT